jgi:hypothetical protein
MGSLTFMGIASTELKCIALRLHHSVIINNVCSHRYHMARSKISILGIHGVGAAERGKLNVEVAGKVVI